jgi:hypothetical protein
VALGTGQFLRLTSAVLGAMAGAIAVSMVIMR